MQKPVAPNRSNYNTNYNKGLDYDNQLQPAVNELNETKVDLEDRKNWLPNQSDGEKDVLGQNTSDGLDRLIESINVMLSIVGKKYSSIGSSLDRKMYLSDVDAYNKKLKKYNELFESQETQSASVTDISPTTSNIMGGKERWNKEITRAKD